MAKHKQKLTARQITIKALGLVIRTLASWQAHLLVKK